MISYTNNIIWRLTVAHLLVHTNESFHQVKQGVNIRLDSILISIAFDYCFSDIGISEPMLISKSRLKATSLFNIQIAVNMYV